MKSESKVYSRQWSLPLWLFIERNFWISYEFLSLYSIVDWEPFLIIVLAISLCFMSPDVLFSTDSEIAENSYSISWCLSISNPAAVIFPFLEGRDLLLQTFPALWADNDGKVGLWRCPLHSLLGLPVLILWPRINRRIGGKPLRYQNNVSAGIALLGSYERAQGRTTSLAPVPRSIEWNHGLSSTEIYLLSNQSLYGYTKLMMEQILSDFFCKFRLFCNQSFVTNPIGAHESGLIGEVQMEFHKSSCLILPRLRSVNYKSLAFSEMIMIRTTVQEFDYIHVSI